MMKELNSPLKRVGFLVLICGLLTLVIGILQIAGDTSRIGKILGLWIGSALFDKYSFRNYPAACYGTWIAIAGLMTSFLYDQITGKLIEWIRCKEKEVSDGTVTASKPLELHFKNASSALEYICKYMNTRLVENELTPCLVVATSQSAEAGAFAVIKIPTDDGPKKAVAAFLGETAPDEIAGKLCGAIIGPINPVTGDPVLMLCSELEPSWSSEGWKIKRHF